MATYITVSALDDSSVQKIFNSPSKESPEYIDADVLYTSIVNIRTGLNNLITQATTLDTNTVFTTSDQSVAGTKTFTTGISFASAKGVKDTSLAIGSTLAAGDRELRLHTSTDGTAYATFKWINSSTSFALYTDTGTTLAKLAIAAGAASTDAVRFDQVILTTGAQSKSGVLTFTTLPESSSAPTTGNQFVNKTYADGLVVTNQGIFQQTSPVTTNNALRVDTTDTDNPIWWRGDGTNQRQITGIQQATSEPASLAAGNLWIDKTDTNNPILMRKAASNSYPMMGIKQGTSQPSVIATGNIWVDKTSTTRPELKWYNGSASVSLQPAVITPKVVTLTDGATPALDASLGNHFNLVAAGDRTIAVPTNPTAGQKIVIAHTASGANRTLSLNTGTGGFRFGTDITALTATTSGKTDYIGAIYNSTDDKWDVVAYVKGY